MKIIIGNLDRNMERFIRDNNFKDHFRIINKMCNIKLIKEPVEVIIPFGFIKETGIVENTMVHIDELIISLEVKKIYYGNVLNHKYCEYIERVFNVPCEYAKTSIGTRTF